MAHASWCMSVGPPQNLDAHPQRHHSQARKTGTTLRIFFDVRSSRSSSASTFSVIHHTLQRPSSSAQASQISPRNRPRWAPITPAQHTVPVSTSWRSACRASWARRDQRCHGTVDNGRVLLLESACHGFSDTGRTRQPWRQLFPRMLDPPRDAIPNEQAGRKGPGGRVGKHGGGPDEW
jgi:hypothetical protein